MSDLRAPTELQDMVLAAFIEARDEPERAVAVYDRLCLTDQFQDWLGEREYLGWAKRLRAAGHTYATLYYPDYDGPTDPHQLTDREKAELLDRDAHRCRWCGLPVLSDETCALHGLPHRGKDPVLVDKKLPFGRRTLGGGERKHLVRFALRAVADHYPKPHSQGGRTNAENLLTACGLCNFRVRGHYREEALGMVPLPEGEHLEGWPT